MTLSVIIPCREDEAVITRCLASLDRLASDGTAVEVCVVDDGGGLDPNRIGAAVGRRFTLVWRSFDAPRGRSAARNEGIAASSGDILAFLDADMEAGASFAMAHLDAHGRRPRTAVVGHIQWPRGGGFHRYIGTRGVAKLAPGGPVPPWYFVTGNASIERRDLPPGPVFDESLPGWGGEDLDLGMRLGDAGIAFAYEPDAVSYHHFTGGLGGHLRRMEHYGRETVPVLVERHPALRHVLRLESLDSPWWRALVHPALAAPVAMTTAALDRLNPPAIVYDYLTYAAYARGWIAGARP